MIFCRSFLSRLFAECAARRHCGSTGLTLIWHGGFVQIATEKAKGARRRLVEMPANLKAWLLPDSARTGRLWPWSPKEYYRRLEAARIKARIGKWPSSALRHSYA